MALTAAQRLSVFAILGIPVVKPQEFYQDLSDKQTVNRDLMMWYKDLTLWPYEYDTAAITAVDARLAALTSAEEEKVSTLIDAWDAIELKTVMVKTDTIALTYYNERARIRAVLQTIIPIYVKSGLANDNPAVSIG